MRIRNIAVIGAGNMGSGIAQAFAQSGFAVKLHDLKAEAIDVGIARLRGPLEKRVASGKMTQEAFDLVFAHLSPAPDLADAVADADLVIEAVFEDLDVKREVFTRLDQACPAKTILATNTSSFCVRDVAAATSRPDRVVGLHFFFPANINKLLEVVRGPETSDAAFDAAYAAGKAAGKVCIETADAPGFCVNRFFVPWLNESCRLLEEGHTAATVEAAAKKAFGIGMGPFELMNITGMAIALHAQETLHKELGAFYEPAAALREQVAKGGPWDLAGTPDEGAAQTVAARLRGVAFGIAGHIVENDIATMRDTDRGATIGLRWAKGPFAMMNDLGLDHALQEVRAVHKTWGEAFPVPHALERLAGAGEAWHLPAVELTWPARHTALVTFCRPEAMNALDEHVLRDLDAAIDEVEKQAPRALVLTGEGKAFIAGADIPTMKRLDVAGATAYTRLGNRVLDRLAHLDVPVLMAINGFAFGGGLELALCGDLLYASDKAQLGLPEVGLGIHPGFGGTQRLPRRVGIGVAKELVFIGRTLDADEAVAVGLVNAVVPHADLLDTVLDTAATIATKAPLAVAGAKRSMDADSDLAAGLRHEQESVVLLFETRDKDEGLSAFLERRPPVFTGA